MDALEFLRGHVPLFSGLSDEALTPLAQASQLITFKKGQTVLFKGATVDGLHVVCAGAVSVQIKEGSQGLKTVATLGPGEVFGETSVIEMGTAGALLKAEDETYVLLIPQQAFRGLLAADPAFVERVRALIASRRPPEPPKRG